MTKELFKDMPKTVTYVKPNDKGLPIAYTGCSSIDNNDHHISTNNLRADEVPEVLMDAKTTAEYLSKLINKDLNKPNGVWND